MNASPTMEQLRQAFEALAVCDHDLARMGFEQAMRHPSWPRVIDIKARAMRTARYKANTTRRIRHVRRVHPVTGAWVTQLVPGEFDETQPCLPV